jgi:hypothetical protein
MKKQGTYERRYVRPRSTVRTALRSRRKRGCNSMLYAAFRFAAKRPSGEVQSE